MAKSRAQRKAEQRRKRESGTGNGLTDSEAQHDTQVPESGEVAEVEAAMEAGAAEASRLESPAPSRADVGRPGETEAERTSRRERRRQEKEAGERAKAQLDRRSPKAPSAERKRGPVISFFISVSKELQKVQWPDRDTLVQASAVTLLFVAVAAAYLGILDAIFSRLVDLVI